MENLKTPVKRILLNSIDYTKVGAYYDAVGLVNVLSFKDYGVNIPYVAANFHGAKTCSNEGTVTSLEIELAPACPCIECDWEYGVTISKIVKNPGVNNNQTNLNRKSYTGTVSKITCTAGVIDDTWLLQAEDDIITQIFNDTITGNDPVNGGGAWVSAVRGYYITVTHAVTENVLVTETSTGTPTTVTLGITPIASAIAYNASAANTYSRAINVSATQMFIYGLDGGDLFTLADGGGGTTVTGITRRIWFRSLNPDVQFGIMYDTGFATTYKKYLYVIDGSLSASSVANSGVTVFRNGVASNIATGAGVNTATLFTAAVVAAAITGVYATTIGNVNTGNTYISGNSAITSMAYAASKSPSNYATYTIPTVFVQLDGTYMASGSGSFPILTGRELIQLLSADSNQGSLAQWDTSDKPDPTVDYCSYWFQLDSNIPALNGASHWDHYRGVIEVYIKSSLVNTAFLYPSANATAISGQGTSLNGAPSTTAVVDFEELLQAWAGTGTIAQATGIVTGGSNPNSWTN